MKKIIGMKLRLLRTEKGFTQLNIAEMIVVSESTYRRIESGEGFLEIETLQNIMSLFGTKLSTFFLELENESKNEKTK